jgi:hypothetical protein
MYRRVIQRAEAQAFADENGMEYIETSAKSADGVDEAFMSTAERIWEKSKSGGIARRTTGLGGGDDTVNLGGKSNVPYGRKKCCS